MNAIILAGGFGSRLMPLTNNLPKPMLALGNYPMLDYTVSQLYNYGISNMVFTLSYMPEKIISWTNGYEDIICRYNIENAPLGTCGGVKDAAKYLDDTFIVMSGDGLSNIDLEEMRRTHFNSGADITIAVTGVRDPSLYGVADLDEAGFVKGFVEKPKGRFAGNYINCGVYIINKKVLLKVPDTKFDFSKDLFPKVLADGGKIAAYRHEGYWSDVGDMNSYLASNLHIISGSFYQPAPHALRKNLVSKIYTGKKPSLVSKTARIVGHIDNCVIGADSTVASGAVLEDCVVLSSTIVHGRHSKCIILNNYAIDVREFADIPADIQNSANFYDNIF